MGSGWCDFCRMWHSASCGHPNNPANKVMMQMIPINERPSLCPIHGPYGPLGVVAMCPQCWEEEKAQLAQYREALGEAIKLQKKYYGNATGLHIAMIGWAKKVRCDLGIDTGEGDAV